MARDVRVNIVGDTSRLERSLNRIDGRMASTGKAAVRMQSVIAGALAGGAVVRGVGAIVTTFASYDTALREVGAVSGATGQQLDQMGDIARRAGLATGVGATEATKAMGELAKAGLSTAQIGPALKGTLALAQAGGLDTASAASAAANAMQTFGLAAKDTTKIADTFANAANLTTADVGDFALALSQGGAAAKIAGLSFSDTSLVLTELARIGIKGSDAGTSLKSAFLQLAAPTDAATAAMKKYGLTFFDANGKVRDAADISDMLRGKLGRLSNQQQIQVLKTIAGTDGFRTLAAMMKVSGTESDALAAQLGKTGSAAETAQAKQAGFEGSMNKLRASAQELGISLGERFAPQIAKFADKLSGLAADPAFKDRLVQQFDMLADGASSAWDAVEPGVKLVGDLAAAFTSLPTGVQSTALQFGALALVARKLSGPLGFVGAAAGIGRMRSEMAQVPAVAKKAERAMLASQAATARANGRFAMPAVPIGDLTGTARQQAVLARRQAAAAERLAAMAPGPTRRERVTAAAGRGAANARGLGRLAADNATPVAVASLVTVMVAKGLGEAAKSRAVERHAAKYAKDVAAQTERGIDQGLKATPARQIGGARADARDAANRLRNLNKVLDGRSLSLTGDSFQKEYRQAEADARKAAPKLVRAFSDSLKSVKNTDATTLTKQFRASFAGMPKVAQEGGARAMLEFARGLEKTGNAPKGTVAALAARLSAEFGVIVTPARKAGRDASRAIDEGLNDRKLAGSSNKLAERLSDQFSQLPRAAVRTVPGAVAVLGSQLGKLEQIAKAKNTPKAMRDQANAALPGLRRAYDQSLDRVAKRLGLSKSEARDWSSSVGAATRRAGSSSADVRALADTISTLNARFQRGKGVADAVRDAWKAAGASAKDAAAVAEGVGAVAGLPGLFGNVRRRGGTIRRYQGGGLVPALVSSGEEIEYGGRSMIVPGERVAADNVAMMLPVGAKVWTDHGQALRAAGVPDGQAMAQQLPHFAKGGIVEAAKAGRAAGWKGEKLVTGVAIAGPESGYRNSARLANSIEDSRGFWQINTKAHTWARSLNLADPYVNAKAAERVYRAAGGWKPWAGYTGPDGRGSDGPWRGYVGRARKAVVATRGSRSGGNDPNRTGETPDRTVTRTTDDLHRITPAGARRNMALYRQPAVDVSSVFDQARAGTWDAAARTALLNEITSAGRVNVQTSTETIPGKAGKLTATGRVTSSFKNRLEGTAGGGTKLRRLTAALGTMQRIAAKGLPYTYGGGHGKLGVGNPGFDCSGYVSAGLGAAGWIKSPMATQQGSGLNTLGVSGAGKFLTWGVRGSSGRQAHTMMKIGSQYFESGSGHGPRRVSGWAGKFAYRHMPGYARGGTVGQLGPRAPRAAKAAVARFGKEAFNPASPAFVGWGFRTGGLAPNPANVRYGSTPRITADTVQALGARSGQALRDLYSAGTRDNNAVTNALDLLQEVLGNAKRVTVGRLEELARQLDIGIRRTVAKSSPGGAEITRGEAGQNRRSRSALALAQAELLARAGKAAAVADRAAAASTQDRFRFDIGQRIAGVDPGSSAGLTAELGQMDKDRAALLRQKAALAKAADIARKAGKAGSAAYKALTEQIAELDNSVLETAAKRAEITREMQWTRIGEQSAGLDFFATQASLTADNGDDRSIVLQRQNLMNVAAGQAMAAGRIDKATEYLAAMKAAADEVAGWAREDAAARISQFDLRAQYADMSGDTAGSTQILREKQWQLERDLEQAQAAGDQAWQSELISSLMSVRDALRSLPSQEAARRATTLSYREALAAMTETLDDDRQVQLERQAEAQSNLIAAQQRIAQASTDAERALAEQEATGFATELKGVTDALKAADTAQQERDQAQAELTDLMKRMVENQERIIAGSQAQSTAMNAAIAAAASGGIGSTIVRQAASPSYAGGQVRY